MSRPRPTSLKGLPARVVSSAALASTLTAALASALASALAAPLTAALLGVEETVVSLARASRLNGASSNVPTRGCGGHLRHRAPAPSPIG